MGDLRARLAERIRRDGPIGFDQFMDAALYDPDDGFYSSPPVGPRGDFVTSPHVSEAFGSLLARQLDGWPDIVEAGAGDGTLATQLTAKLPGVRYRAIERSPGARDALEARGIPVLGSLKEIEPITGVILANELLDNLPFRLFRGDEEVLVALDGDRFVARRPHAGEERIVCEAALELVRDAIGALQRGYVIVYDYEATGTRAFQGHRVHERVFDEPGRTDITSGVDFVAIAREAERCGATIWGPRSQREVLMRLGYKQWYEALRLRRMSETDPHQMLRLISEQSKAPLLVDEQHLGSLKVIAFGVGVSEPPPGLQ